MPTLQLAADERRKSTRQGERSEMRKLKLVLLAVFAVAALSAVAAATASAALPEFLPGNAGEKFTGKSGSGTLEVPGEGPIVCKEDSVTGENVGTTKKEALALITFKGCTVFGFIGAKSLGDAEGTILVHAELKLCYISKANKEVGVLTKVLPVHIEVAGKLIVVEGDQVGKITPVNTSTTKYSIKYEQKEGKPKPEGCEGEKEHYTASVNEGTPKESGEATTEETTYEKAQTLDA
jgi:hypothetical protein